MTIQIEGNIGTCPRCCYVMPGMIKNGRGLRVNLKKTDAAVCGEFKGTVWLEYKQEATISWVAFSRFARDNSARASRFNPCFDSKVSRSKIIGNIPGGSHIGSILQLKGRNTHPRLLLILLLLL